MSALFSQKITKNDQVLLTKHKNGCYRILKNFPTSTLKNHTKFIHIISTQQWIPEECNFLNWLISSDRTFLFSVKRGANDKTEHEAEAKQTGLFILFISVICTRESRSMRNNECTLSLDTKVLERVTRGIISALGSDFYSKYHKTLTVTSSNAVMKTIVPHENINYNDSFSDLTII